MTHQPVWKRIIFTDKTANPYHWALAAASIVRHTVHIILHTAVLWIQLMTSRDHENVQALKLKHSMLSKLDVQESWGFSWFSGTCQSLGGSCLSCHTGMKFLCSATLIFSLLRNASCKTEWVYLYILEGITEVTRLDFKILISCCSTLASVPLCFSHSLQLW